MSESKKAARVEKAKNIKGIDTIVKTAQALETLKVEYVPIDSVKPNQYNPNRQSPHDFELLRVRAGQGGVAALP